MLFNGKYLLKFTSISNETHKMYQSVMLIEWNKHINNENGWKLKTVQI